MYFSKAFISSVLLGCAAATNHEAGASHTAAPVGTKGVAAAAPSAPVVGMVNTHVVRVGGPNGTLRFYPDTLAAEIGDLVQFQFYPKNHSVVQSTFDRPCVPIHDVMPNKTDAFFSGFMPTNISQTATTDILTYTIRVTNKQPMWYYCSQGQHCQGGMVGVINPPAGGNRTVESFAVLAKSATQNLSPGQASGSGAGAGSSGVPPAGAPPSPTGSDSGAGAGAAPGASGTATTSGQPLQATTNASPGRLVDSAKQSILGMGLAGLAAFMML